MSEFGAVLTGDIVKSRAITDKARLNASLRDILAQLAERHRGQFDIFRGDSFQLLLPEADHAVAAAVLIRAALIMHSDAQRWDARIAVASGEIHFLGERVSESQGPVFEASGLGLEQLSASSQRLLLVSSAGFAPLLALATRFADAIISDWTHFSAEVVYWTLSESLSQQALAQRLARTQPTINSRLATARYGLIHDYLHTAGTFFGKDG